MAGSKQSDQEGDNNHNQQTNSPQKSKLPENTTITWSQLSAQLIHTREMIQNGTCEFDSSDGLHQLAMMMMLPPSKSKTETT